jgi:hypothetical protein
MTRSPLILSQKTPCIALRFVFKSYHNNKKLQCKPTHSKVTGNMRACFRSRDDAVGRLESYDDLTLSFDLLSSWLFSTRLYRSHA